MSPFNPSGERARWRILYDLLSARTVGDVLTYDQMGKALDLDPRKDRTPIQLAMRRAASELEHVDKQAVDSIVNVGYIIVKPEEHLGLAKRHQRRASTQLVRGHSKVVNVDFNEMEPETRKAFEVMAGAFARQIDFMQRIDVRQRHLEEAVATVTRQTEEQAQRTDEDIEELRARLRRLEEKAIGSE